MQFDEEMSWQDWIDAINLYNKEILSGNVGRHTTTVDRMNEQLLARPLGKEGIQNNPYDRAKNWSGGYDWASRSGHSLEDIRKLGLAYQRKQSIFGNRANELQDFQQNMEGALAALRDRRTNQLKSVSDILRAAEEYGLLTPLPVEQWR